MLNYCALDIKSINRKSFVAWSCFCHTEKIKLVQSDRCFFFFLWQPLILFKLFRLRDVFPGDLNKNMLCEVCLISGFQLEMGSESKENHLSCLYASFFCLWEVTIAVIHGGTSIENTFKYIASWLLCDFLNHKYEANL